MSPMRHVPLFARPATPRGADAPAPEDEARKLVRPPQRRAAAKRFREIELADWLVERHELDPDHARAVAIRLLSSTPRIRGAFQRWWLTGRVDDVTVEGYNLRRLVEEKGMSPLGALLTLSLLEAGRGLSGADVDRREHGDLRVEEALELLEG